MLNDLRYAIRQLLKNPGFTAVAVLTLALGIGANTAIFTVVNALLLRSLPVNNPEELVQVVTKSGSSSANSFSYPFYKMLRDDGRSLSGLFAAGGVGERDQLIVPGGGNTEVEFVHGQAVSGNFFTVLGVPAMLGRTLTLADDQAGDPQAAVVISHGFWERRFAADSAVIGRAVNFKDMPFTIVGVTAPKYHSLRRESVRGRGASYAIATMANFQSVVGEVFAAARVRGVKTMDDVVNASVHQERVVAQLGGFFSLFALALACLGLYGVLSFAVVQRTREIGVRVALGARRRGILSLVIGQGVRLALVGTVAGIGGAFATTRLVSSLLFGVTATDPITFIGAPSLLVLVAVLASWLPARRATKVDPMEALRYE